jgi:2-polyprenyl-3-methyl-5-hydroxy-6-metoxy-1,4-benzoquinol methylase
MEKYGVQCTPKEFYEAVNVHFHAAESLVYDQVHRDMWKALPQQFSLLTDDCLSATKKPLRVLDIGCGTGLSAQLFLDTTLGHQTEELYLLDTSKEMLKQGANRASQWRVALKIHCGSIADLSAAEKFDVILACSVLHHIADLASFLDRVSHHQDAAGIFLHLQDQNADTANDPEYLSRINECRHVLAQPNRGPTLFDRIAWKIRKRNNYIAKANKSMLKAGIIKHPMEELDIWQVTDIRITPTSNGVSLRELRSLLPRYDLLSCRSYAFYGQIADGLPLQFRAVEAQLIQKRALNGHSISGAWIKRGA